MIQVNCFTVLVCKGPCIKSVLIVNWPLWGQRLEVKCYLQLSTLSYNKMLFITCIIGLLLVKLARLCFGIWTWTLKRSYDLWPHKGHEWFLLITYFHDISSAHYSIFSIVHTTFEVEWVFIILLLKISFILLLFLKKTIMWQCFFVWW